MKKYKYIFTLLMAVVMVAMSPTRVWADDLTPLTADKCTELGLDATTYTGYYAIGTVSDLTWFRSKVNSGNVTYNAVLTANIDMSSVCHAASEGVTKANWTPIGNSTCKYAGTFDGNGKTVEGLYYDGEDWDIGFIGVQESGEDAIVKNLTVKGSFTSTGGRVGGIVGYSFGKISNCTNQVTIQGKEYIGGIVGFAYGNISNCTNQATIKATSEQVGGIVGYAIGINVTSCCNYGDVISNSKAGGICGEMGGNSSIFNSYNTGNISGSTVGGIIGHICSNATVTVENVFSTGTVSGDSYSNGAFVGEIGEMWSSSTPIKAYATATFINCYYDNTKCTLSYCADTNYNNKSGSDVSVTGKSTTAFASGEVAYLLNGSRSESTTASPLVWYQKLPSTNSEQVVSGDATPVLKAASGNTVYAFYNATGTLFYTNDPDDLRKVNTFDVAITKAGDTEAAVSKKSATLVTIDKSTEGKPQVTVQHGTETATPTAFVHSTRYNFSLTPVAINPGSDNLSGNIVAKAPRHTAAAPEEPTLTGPALVIGTSTAYTTYPLDAEHTSITLALSANGNYIVNGTKVQDVTSIYYFDPAQHVLPQDFTDGVKKCTECNAVCEVQFTYTASSADAATAINNKFNNKFSSFGAVTCGSWTDASTPVAVTIAADVTSIPICSLQSLSGLTSITIPSSVTSIGSYAFSDCTALTSVTIPGSVTSIGESAFWGCSSLATITIPEGVETISNNAFTSTGISALNIPKGVTSIGNSITSGCASLATITVAEDNPVFKSQDNCVITKSAIGTQGESGYVAANTLVLGCKNSTIPSSVTSIGNYAFYNAGLSTITIPEGVTTIGEWAFGNCSALTSITLPSTLQTIGELAFFKTGFTSITIPSNVTNIGYEAFGMTALTTIILEGTSTAAGNSLFYLNDILQAIYVPASSVDTYKAASGWSDYAEKIKAIPVTLTSGSTTSGYTTFPAALAAAADGSTITLNQDVTIQNSSYAILIYFEKYPTAGLTIDLGQKTLTLERTGTYGGEAINILAGNKITIKNGTLDVNKYGVGINAVSPLTLDGVTVDGTDLDQTIMGPYDKTLCTIQSIGTDIVLNNSIITAPSGQYSYYSGNYSDGNALTLNGTSKMDGNINLHNCIMKAANTATITNCTLYDTGSSLGALSINDGTFTAPTGYGWKAGTDGLSLLYSSALSLNDEKDPTSTLQALVAANVAQNITITGRTLYKDGYYNTLCLPFALTATELAASPLAGCTLKEVTGASLNTTTNVMTIQLTEATALEAGKPYLIKWDAASENIVSPTFTGVTITKSEPSTITGDNLDVVGIFAPKTMATSDTDLFFLGAENKFYTSDQEYGGNLKGYRCYFKQKGVSGGAKSLNFVIDDDETTSINNEQLTVNNEAGAKKHIENGRIVIERDGKKYNVNGQVIK